MVNCHRTPINAILFNNLDPKISSANQVYQFNNLDPKIRSANQTYIKELREYIFNDVISYEINLIRDYFRHVTTNPTPLIFRRKEDALTQLIDSRHTSPDHQHKYDKKFGLIIKPRY